MITRGKMADDLKLMKNMLEDIKRQLETKATTEQIEKLLEQIKEKDKKIESLENRVAELEGKLLIQSTVNALLERKVDDGEQYTRRLNLRINGIPCGDKEKETSESCLTKVMAEVGKLGIAADASSFDRAHRIGPLKRDENGKALPRPMIVRLTSWRARTNIYVNRKKENGTKVKFYVDLTKRRFQLKKTAYERAANNPNVDFVFADVNCNLGIRFKNGEFRFFNSVEELDTILL